MGGRWLAPLVLVIALLPVSHIQAQRSMADDLERLRQQEADRVRTEKIVGVTITAGIGLLVAALIIQQVWYAKRRK